MRSKAGPLRRWAVGAAVVLVVTLAAADGVTQQRGGADGRPEPGFLAPDFTLPDLNGGQIKLSDFRGKTVVFLNFWASWCPSCQKEMPTMETLYRRFKEQGLEIVAVSIDKDKGDVRKFMRTHSLTFPILLDPDLKAVREYRVTAIPTHYFIDQKGVIRSREVGAKDWSTPETWKAVEELLR